MRKARLLVAALLLAGCGNSPVEPISLDNFGPGCTVACRDRGPSLSEVPAPDAVRGER